MKNLINEFVSACNRRTHSARIASDTSKQVKVSTGKYFLVLFNHDSITGIAISSDPTATTPVSESEFYELLNHYDVTAKSTNNPTR